MKNAIENWIPYKCNIINEDTYKGRVKIVRRNFVVSL